jgi:hypothetical protein
MSKFLSALLAVCLLSASTAQAKTYGSANQLYDSSVGGIRDIMINLRIKDPKVAAALEGDLKRMEMMRMLGMVIPAAMFTGGGIILGRGVGAGVETQSLVGIAIMALAVPLYFFLTPGQGDFATFIQKHNNLRASDPLKLNVGVDVEKKTYTVGLTYSF